MLQIVGFAVLGILAGTLSGLLGIGGAIIIIPALMFLFEFTQKTAQGTTLLLMIPPIGIFAALEYWRSGNVNLKAAIIIALFFIAGGWLGSKLALKLDPLLLKRIFAGFLIIIAVRMLIK